MCRTYFIIEEARETLRKNQKFSFDLPIEQKTHTYDCTGAVYTGQMKGGFRHGSGKMAWKDGSQYVGSWVMGVATGQGKFSFSSGDEYFGRWHNNKAHGQGKNKSSEGVVYEGQWVEDFKHGYGVET